MDRQLLNLALLRGEQNSTACVVEQEQTPAPPIALTRRRLLGLAGVAAFGLAPAARALGSAVRSPFEMVGDRRRLEFQIGGRTCWVIDPARFGGRPRLSVDSGEHRIRLTLRDAVYPGTGMPADFDCTLTRGLRGWTMRLRMELGGVQFEAPFERWLAGTTPARALARLDGIVAPLSGVATLRLGGLANGELSPDWTLRFTGDEVAELEGLSAPARADAVTLSLLDPRQPSLFSAPPARRALLTIDRGAGSWAIPPSVEDVGGWAFTARGDVFDQISIETGLTSGGIASGALVAESTSTNPALALAVGAGILPLRATRFAVACEGPQRHSALLARFDEQPVWLHGDAGSLQVGDRPESSPLEIIVVDGAVQQARIEPALIGSYLPIAGGMTEPANAVAGQTVRLIHDERLEQPRDATSVRFNPMMPQDPVARMMVMNPRIPVIRPKDLLHLEFEFGGMKIEMQGNKRVAVRENANAFLVVHFPPQNIAEQAFFEEEIEATNPENPTVKPVLPVLARFAHPSRLAFSVPSSVSSIPLDIDTLLKAMSEYPASLVPTALPPKQLGSIGALISRDDLQNLQVGAVAKPLTLKTDANISVVPAMRVPEDAPFASRPPRVSGARFDRTAVGTTRRTGRDVSRISQLRSGSLSAAQLGAVARASSRVQSSRSEFESTWAMDLSDFSVAVGERIDFDVIRGLVNLKPPLEEPKSNQTAIETPYRLIISPNRYGRWAHSLGAVSHEQPVSGRTHTELWHTRLGVEGSDDSIEYETRDEVDERATQLRTIRAVWARTYGGFSTDYTVQPDHYAAPGTVAQPYRMSLDEYDRHNLVHLSANFRIDANISVNGRTVKFQPKPITVDRLMLSSLGAWMNVRGAWEPPSPMSVEEWRHRATMGRDNYVRVVYKGYLFPFGHRAALIKVTERKLQMTKWGNIAYLRQRMFIVVRQPEKNLRTSGLMRKNTDVIQNNGSGEALDLQFPFTTVRVLTVTTPNLDRPEDTQFAGKGQSAFLPYVADKPFKFRLKAIDVDKQTSEFSMPLAFIESNYSDNASVLKTVRNEYDARDLDSGSATVRPGAAPFEGQKIAYAASDKLGDTTYETDEILFSAEIPNATVKLSLDQPRFYPVLKSAKLSVPAIKHVVGNTQQTAFKYNAKFLQHEFSASNKGKLMLDLFAEGGTAAPIKLDFEGKGDRSGGFAKPNMGITGLSRDMGPVGGDPADIVDGKFDAEKFFAALGDMMPAKLFGVLNLWDIVAGIAEAAGLDKAPQFLTEAMTTIQALQNDLNALKTLLSKPEVGSFGSTVKTDITNVLDALSDLLSDPTNTGPLQTALDTFRTDVLALRDAIPTVSFDPGLKRSIQTLLQNFANELAQASNVVAMITRVVDAMKIPEEIKITFAWEPALKSWPESDPIFDVRAPGSGFRLGAEIVAKTNFKSEPRFDIVCALEKFKINLIAPANFIVLHFARLGFYASSASKADVVCDFERLEFVGVLSFIETLRTLIPLDGFSDPPALDISEKGIDASFSIALPNIAFGVFAMSNMTLGAGFTVPFIGDPLSFRFNFCTRENPFTLQISFIGGGGFFGITIDPGGVQILEASFEVGVTLAMDFAVASGMVYAMAGVYFKMQGGDCELTAYFRVGGNVSVLGIISVSIELYLSMTYEFATGKLVGRATLTISIEIFFFEIDVELSCEKKFAGSNGDPTFAELMAPYEGQNLLKPGTTITVEPWKEYVAAFAW